MGVLQQNVPALEAFRAAGVGGSPDQANQPVPSSSSVGETVWSQRRSRSLNGTFSARAFERLSFIRGAYEYGDGPYLMHCLLTTWSAGSTLLAVARVERVVIATTSTWTRHETTG